MSWTRDDLAAWQSRLGLSGVEAARLLGLPYLTYRNFLTGRRHKAGLPEWVARLCTYAERYGPLAERKNGLDG